MKVRGDRINFKRRQQLYVCVITFLLCISLAFYCWSLTFIVCGDSRSDNGPVPVSDKYGMVIDRINSAENIAFVVHTGDFYSGSANKEESFRQASIFMLINKTIKIPFYPVMGNHEASGEGWVVCKELLFNGTTTYYSFAFENSYFIILDLHQPWYEYNLSEEQKTWFLDEIKKYRQGKYKHLFIFAHPPLFPLRHVGKSLDKYTEIQKWLRKRFVKAGVDIFFCGHDHFYSRLYYQGVFQLISGGAGAPLYKPKTQQELPYSWNNIKYFNVISTYHWVKVDVIDELVDVTVYSLEDKVIDRFKIKKVGDKIEFINK